MRKSSIKNLVIKNIRTFTYGFAFISYNLFMLVKADEYEKNYNNLLNTKIEYINTVEADASIKNINVIPITIDDMFEMELFEDTSYVSEKENIIDTLTEMYENGYDYEHDIEIDNEKFMLTTENKTYEHLSEEDFYLFAAIVEEESNGNVHDAIAVASSVLNRCDSNKWVDWLNSMGKDGTNPIEHLTTDGQYSVYDAGTYINHLDGNVSEDVMNACKLVWFDGVRNNNYCSFRSNSSSGYSDNLVVFGGNRFGDEIECVKTISK